MEMACPLLTNLWPTFSLVALWCNPLFWPVVYAPSFRRAINISLHLFVMRQTSSNIWFHHYFVINEHRLWRKFNVTLECTFYRDVLWLWKYLVPLINMLLCGIVIKCSYNSFYVIVSWPVILGYMEDPYIEEWTFLTTFHSSRFQRPKDHMSR